MARRRKVKLGICFYVMLVVFVILLIVLAALVVPTWWEAVANRDRVETKSYDFTESARDSSMNSPAVCIIEGMSSPLAIPAHRQEAKRSPVPE